MIYHIPLNEDWRADAFADALSRCRVNARLDTDRVVVLLPLLAMPDLERMLAIEDIEELALLDATEVVGETTATVTYHEDRVLENLTVDTDQSVDDALKNRPDHSPIRNAMQACNYVCGNEREIAMRYLGDSTDADKILGKIHDLQLEKESLVARGLFDDARTAFEQQRLLRRNLEDMIRSVS